MTGTPVQERRLDLREFQDIVDEARKLIPRYCPEWTDHNVSDPGITIIELFAWMTEMILYQLNRVPDEMYERFLDLIGVQRLPPQPSETEITFYLSSALTRPLTIPADTEVATDRTEFQEAIVFSTMKALTIAPPRLQALRAWREGRGFEDYMPYVTSGLIEAPLFNEQPVEGDAIYAGYEGQLAGSSLLLRLDFDELEGAHIDPRNPPLAWEYWSATTRTWAPLRLLDQSGTGRLRDAATPDPTYGLNRPGDVYVNVPFDSAPQIIDGMEATWIRVRYVNREGQGYTTSPRLRAIRTESIGGTVPARQTQLVQDEVLGKSDGTAGQRFVVSFQPLVRQDEPHAIEAELENEVTEWREVEDFSLSSESDRHFTIHYASGEVRFGPSVRDRDGTQVQHGAVPRKDAVLRLVRYRSGGGTLGNVGAGTVTQLKTSLPYVAGVINYKPAVGGLNEEELDQAKLRAIAVLKRPITAVTREDYERLALEVDGVGRARCIPSAENGNQTPGVIRLLLVPQIAANLTELTAAQLMPSPTLIQQVAGHLDERKSLGTVVELGPAPLVWAEIDAHIYVARGLDTQAMEEEAARLLRFLLHPTFARGSPSAGFGGVVTVSQVAGALQSLPNVVYIERVRLRRRGDASEVMRVQAPADSLLVLGRCYVLAEVVQD
jgi:predicted phage baseplate assembly protein